MEPSWVKQTNNNPSGINRYAVQDPGHYDSLLWREGTLIAIQEEIAFRLRSNPNYFIDPQLHPGVRIRPLIVPLEQIKNVADSVSESNPRVGTQERMEMIVDYIVKYLENEETINQTPVYDKKVIKYDGSFGIQQLSQGQIPIRKKGLNPIGRMF